MVKLLVQLKKKHLIQKCVSIYDFTKIVLFGDRIKTKQSQSFILHTYVYAVGYNAVLNLMFNTIFFAFQIGYIYIGKFTNF